MPKINLGKVVGEKGDPFTYEDFTQEQLDEITPKILKGNVTTLDPDENATVNIRKEGLNNYLDFGIPRGKNGAEIENISAENVDMADGDTLEDTMATVNENIDNLNTPTFDDSTNIYTTLNAANTAAETASNAIKSKVSIFTTLSNMKKSFSAIIQGLKILGTNVGMIQGITSDLNSESDYIAASSKALATLNGNLLKFATFTVTLEPNQNVHPFSHFSGLNTKLKNIKTVIVEDIGGNTIPVIVTFYKSYLYIYSTSNITLSIIVGYV